MGGIGERGTGSMSNQGSGYSTNSSWNAPEAVDPKLSMGVHMSTYPSVGRFSNEQATSLYVKGSSAKFNDDGARKSMAPYSNHGLLGQQQSQQPSMGIVDLRTAPGAEGKPMKPATASYLTQS